MRDLYRPLALPVLAALLISAACTSQEHEDAESPGESVGMDAAGQPDALAQDASATSDADGDEDRAGRAQTPPEHVMVGASILFAREEERGVVAGFDLDDHVSGAADPIGCRQEDFVAPDGTLGIDNQFAKLLPLIEAAGGAALEGLVQAAINEGDLLVMFEISGIDDPQNDDSVDIMLMRALGEPFVGADGLVEPWQSFDIDVESPVGIVEDVPIVDGVIKAGPFEFQLPIFVFDFEFLVTIREASARITIGEDGHGVGLIGGSITIENILEIADNIEGGEGIAPVVRNLGTNLADMAPDEDGNCQAISTAVEFDLVPAFIYEDAERPELAQGSTPETSD